jgi:ATP-dependent RNA helicase MRH4
MITGGSLLKTIPLVSPVRSLCFEFSLIYSTKATDDSGNENNVLRVPHKPTEEQVAPAGADTPEIKLNPATQLNPISKETNNIDENTEDTKAPLFAHESLSDTVEEGTEDNNAPLLAHESLGNDSDEEGGEDNNAPLFAHESLGNDTKEDDTDDFNAPLFAHESLGDDTKDDTEEMKTPLFAHECLGAYDIEEEAEHGVVPIAGSSPRQNGNAQSKHDKVANIDVNDPTLETFPSERGSILDAIRTIQTHLGEDQTHLDDIPASPRVVSSRRTSLDSNDDLCLSPATLSPTVTRRRDSRLSHSFGRTRSAVSLGSIEEEPKPSANKRSQGPPIVSLPNPNSRGKIVGQKSPPSEEDEAVVMKTSEVKPSAKTDNESPSQVESYEAQTTHQDKAPSATTTEKPSEATESQTIDDQADDAPSLDKPMEKETSARSDLDSVPSQKEIQSVPDSNNERKTKKTASAGDSSQSPPRGSLVPM